MIEFLQANWVGAVLLAGALALFFLLRNRATRVDELDEIFGQGQPVIVELFSNT